VPVAARRAEVLAKNMHHVVTHVVNRCQRVKQLAMNTALIAEILTTFSRAANAWIRFMTQMGAAKHQSR